MYSKKISLIVPCYNEESALPHFYKATTEVMEKLSYEYDILFVDDGSKDKTLSIIRDFARQDRHVQYISFSRNFGKEAAMYAGFRNAKGDYVAVMDADMQDPPELLPKMVEILEEGNYDSVATRRENRVGEPPIRSWFARKFYKLINRISDADIVDGARDFRLMKREMADAIIHMREHNRFSKGIYGWIGFRTYWLPYRNVERVAGDTKWNFWGLLKYALSGIISFSQIPLAISSWLGLAITTVSMLLLPLIVIRKVIFGDSVSGWTSLVCIILFLGGIQLFCIGILSQYVAKIYMEIKKRPHYIAAESNIEDMKPID